MKKRIILGVTVIGLSLAMAWIYVPLSRARRSCAVFREFVEHVQRAQWQEAQAMLETDPNRFRIEDGEVLYLGGNCTDLLTSAEPRFWPTLEYYLTSRRRGDKVIFRASSVSDYAILENGRMAFVKMP